MASSPSSGEGNSQGGGNFGKGLFARFLEQVREIVNHAFVPGNFYRYICFFQALPIRLTLVAQGIIFGGDNQGRRQAREVRSQERRGQGICPVFRVGQVVA